MDQALNSIAIPDLGVKLVEKFSSDLLTIRWISTWLAVRNEQLS
jgi:hypothetical protein